MTASSLYHEQLIKVEKGEVLSAEIMVYFKTYGGSGVAFIELYDDTNEASLDKETLEEVTTDFVALQVSCIVPTGCSNVAVRWGLEVGWPGDECYFDKVRAYRGSAVRLAE